MPTNKRVVLVPDVTLNTAGVAIDTSELKKDRFIYYTAPVGVSIGVFGDNGYQLGTFAGSAAPKQPFNVQDLSSSMYAKRLSGGTDNTGISIAVIGESASPGGPAPICAPFIALANAEDDEYQVIAADISRTVTITKVDLIFYDLTAASASNYRILTLVLVDATGAQVGAALATINAALATINTATVPLNGGVPRTLWAPATPYTIPVGHRLDVIASHNGTGGASATGNGIARAFLS